MSFDNIIGNNKIKDILIESVKNENILHSYLFYGTEGIGKKIFAKNFAKMALCENKNNKPCNKCKSCIEFDTKNNPDFFLIEPDENSIKVDQIRQMQKSTLEKPIVSEKKVYIIDNADTMTKEAQNCLLKTLEEPQSFIVIILIASNESYILPTVKSRCTKIFFQGLTNSELKAFINTNFTNINLSEDILNLCNGSINKCIKVIEKMTILKQVKSIIDTIEVSNELDIINQKDIYSENKEDIFLLLDYIYVLLFEKVNNSITNKKNYINAMTVIENTKRKLLNSNNFDMTIDNMLIKVWREINEKNYRG